MLPMSTDCPRTFSQGIFLRPKLCSYQVIKLPVAGNGMEVSEAPAVSLTAGYHRYSGRYDWGWCGRAVRSPDGGL